MSQFLDQTRTPQAGQMAPLGPAPIEIRIQDVGQMFESFDPFPFPEKDLDRHAEEFIVNWARELPKGRPLSLVVHLPVSEMARPQAASLPMALQTFFSGRATASAAEIRDLFRLGRRALLVGLCTLAGCQFLARLCALQSEQYPALQFLGEGLVIVGWVANWRPLEIFLYDWLPIRRRQRLFERLAAAPVSLRPY